MFFIHFLRYLHGYVVFTARGDFTERFLNLAVRDHIPIWDGRKHNGIYTGCAPVSRYRDLHRHAKKSGVRLRLADKKGVPFTRYQYRHRHGLLAGTALFVIGLLVSGLFIWRIEVNGNTTIPESVIIQVLESMEVRPGRLRTSIDVRACENRAMLLLGEISWLALNIQGSTIYVEVNESTLPPPMVDPHQPCNIVAAASGQITHLEVLDGLPLVKAGDTVLKGDVIVSGITQDSRGQSLFRHAQARVRADVTYQLVTQVPLTQIEYQETGALRRRTFLSASGLQIPLFLPFPIPHPYRVEQALIPIASLSPDKAPFLLRENYILMEEAPRTLTRQEAHAQALSRLTILEDFRLKDAAIASRALTGTLTGDAYTLTADYACSMEIGEEREILVEKAPEK